MNKQMVDNVGKAMAGKRWVDALAYVSPDVRAHVPAVGVLEGVDALASFLFEATEKTDDGEHFELLDSLIGEHFAALYFRIRANRPGRPPLDNLTLHLARFEDDQIAEIWFHNFDGHAVAEFWA